ncbi:MAG: hypothetical protein ACHQVS_02930 [Candidatus Babeliales bacterium]
MKTLTAKLAVAALLVAGAAQAETNTATVLASGVMATASVFDAGQSLATTWYAQQNKNASRLQRASGAAVNYGLPVAQIAATALLAARANGCDCSVTNSVTGKLSPLAALGALTVLTTGKLLWNKRSAAQVTADAAVAAQVQASAQAAAQATTADASKRK